MEAEVLTQPYASESTVYEADLSAVHAVIRHTDWDLDIGIDSASHVVYQQETKHRNRPMQQ
eukprot:1225217-Amphidinium_carterae.1